jgi:hypothetical protein
MLMEKDMHVIACHEAAHAVTGWMSGEILRHVTIEGYDNRETPYYCQSVSPPGWSRTWINSVDFNRIMAGAAIQEIMGVDTFEGCGMDLENLQKLIDHPDDGSKAMREYLIHHPGTDARDFAEVFLPVLVERLKDPRALACIRGGAAMLEQFGGKVCGQLIVQLFEHCWGDPLPEKAHPAHWHFPPEKTDEPPTQAEALVLLGDAITKLEQAVEQTRTAFRFENEAAEQLAQRTMKHSWWMRDQFQRIEIPLPA